MAQTNADPTLRAEEKDAIQTELLERQDRLLNNPNYEVNKALSSEELRIQLANIINEREHLYDMANHSTGPEDGEKLADSHHYLDAHEAQLRAALERAEAPSQDQPDSGDEPSEAYPWRDNNGNEIGEQPI